MMESSSGTSDTAVSRNAAPSGSPRHFGAVESSVRIALGVADHVDDRLLHSATSLARTVVTADLVPGVDHRDSRAGPRALARDPTGGCRSRLLRRLRQPHLRGT